MELRLSISPETEKRLRADAAAARTDFETYVARLLEMHSRPPRTMLEISGPAYEEFVASGMTEDELVELLEQAKHEMRAERRRAS